MICGLRATNSFQKTKSYAYNKSMKLININNSLILGAGHGIGLALVEQICLQTKGHVFCTYHNESKALELFTLQNRFHNRITIKRLDPLNENALSLFINEIKNNANNLELVINSIGLLHDQQIKPEKGLRDISYESLERVFKINSFITPMLAKYIAPIIPKKEESAFVTISAKVGSIEDNRIGGWYAYRASKSALNMFLKNIAIEWTRKKLLSCVLAIHPGTTKTELSAPYIKNTPYKLHSPTETAVNILKVIEKSTYKNSGSFLSWDGTTIPW